MSNIPVKVRAFLESHNLNALEFEPGSTPTAETAAQRIGVPVGQIAKSILFKGKDDRYRLVVAAGDKKINSGALKRATGAKHRMATADETKEITGFLPGGVCPFGLEGHHWRFCSMGLWMRMKPSTLQPVQTPQEFRWPLPTCSRLPAGSKSR